MTTMTTAVTEATGIPAGIPTSAVAVLPAVSSGTPAAMLSAWSLVAVLVGLAVAIGWALYARAVRVDRLHRQVLGSRATLEAQLVHRAEAAADLATTRALDPASSLLLSRAAREALDAEGPIVDDGLDTSPRLDAATDAAGVAAGAVRATRSRLDRACSRLVLARRFHNTHVSEAQALRSRLLVRVCHLAGHAPMPQTFDADDDTTPEAQPTHDGVQPR